MAATPPSCPQYNTVCEDMCVCVSPLLTVSHRRKSAKKTKVKDVFILTHAHTHGSTHTHTHTHAKSK